jgi:hypothetical protein
MNDWKSSKSLGIENVYEGKDKSKSFDRSHTVGNPKKLRLDKFGNIISKKNNSKYKICFIDQVEKDKNLVEIYRVESYKQYYQIDQKKSKKIIFL